MGTIFEDLPDPDAWKLLSHGPSYYTNKLVPFQTKVRRYYPSVDNKTECAGKTTRDNTTDHMSRKRAGPHGRLTNACSMESRVHTERRSSISTSSCRPIKNFLHEKISSSDPIVKLPQESGVIRPTRRPPYQQHETSSFQVNTVMGSQCPPFGGGQRKAVDRKLSVARMGAYHEPEELIAPLERICRVAKRHVYSKYGGSSNVIEHLDQRPVGLMRSSKQLAPPQKTTSVFNYLLPSKRSGEYKGIIDNPLLQSKNNCDSCEPLEESSYAHKRHAGDSCKPQDNIGADMCPVNDKILEHRPSRSCATVRRKYLDYMSLNPTSDY